MTETRSLFDAPADDEPPAPQPCPPWLVEALVALGVKPETARGYSMRQAYAVRDRMEKHKGAVADRKATTPPADPCREPSRAGATVPERESVRQYLGGVLAEHEAGKASADELYRVLRGSLYVLTADECRRVASNLVSILGEST